ncbi:histone H1-beta, late embryonic-like [Actinia tenebrosa]|uniref:Histone H1-beta, late embryonic-like n=1 Tax=Actinia tenebrosa TaxID=6105 RepID=A0A6P8HIU4_ACTTE|nr:histone H1-beta, late embryonic-like [Actinia tenebrosa]
MSDIAVKKAAKKPAKPAEHPIYNDMVKAAISALKERNGSSRQAIDKYIKGNYKVGDKCGHHLKLALKRMSEKGILVHTKGVGASGSFKLNKAVKDEKPKKKPAKKPVAKKPAKKPAAKKAKKPKSPAKKAAKSPKKAKKAAAEKPKKAAKKPAAKAKPAKKPAAKKPAKKTAKKPAAKKAAKSPKN